jgi:hypothetical protein
MMPAPAIAWGGRIEPERQQRRVMKKAAVVAKALPLFGGEPEADAHDPSPGTPSGRSQPDRGVPTAPAGGEVEAAAVAVPTSERDTLLAERDALVQRIAKLKRYAEGRVLLCRQVEGVTRRLLALELGRR